MRTQGISTERRGRTKMRFKIRRSSKRTDPINSRVSTSCVPCAVSTHACLAACICTSGMEKCWRRIIRRCLAWSRKNTAGRVGKLCMASGLSNEYLVSPAEGEKYGKVSMTAPSNAQNQLQSIEALLQRIEKANDPAMSAMAKDLVQS